MRWILEHSDHEALGIQWCREKIPGGRLVRSVTRRAIREKERFCQECLYDVAEFARVVQSTCCEYHNSADSGRDVSLCF